MVNEELDEARVKEGRRIVQDRHPAHIPQVGEVAREVARLAREGWTPSEPVSNDLLAARAHAKASGWAATAVDAGSCDHTDEVVSFLAGCTRGREGAKGLVEALAERDEHMAARGELFTRALKAEAQRDAALEAIQEALPHMESELAGYGTQAQGLGALKLMRAASREIGAAREWHGARWPGEKESAAAGKQDGCFTMEAYLAGCARGRKGAKELVEAVQWYADNLNAPHGARSDRATADAWRAVSAALASAKRGG